MRLGLCYPKDVTEFSFSGGYARIRGNNPAIQVNSITELDNDNTGKAYFYDTNTGYVLLW